MSERWSGPVVAGNRWDLAPDAPTGAPAPLVAVVVTHFEQPRQLARTLRALERQSHPASRMSVVVVDDGSVEAPVVPPGVGLVRQEDRGFRAAAARNLGARAALSQTDADVVVFLDADTAPEPDFVARMARLPAVLPEAVVVGRRRHAEYDGDERCRELPAPTWLADGWRRTRDLLDADETSFRFVISAVLACSARLWREVGGFDETFAAYGGEDWEWAHRAWTHGALLAHEPDAVAWHDGPDRADRSGEDTSAARERMLRETLAVARRVPVAGVAPGGLIGTGQAAADPLVTVAPAVGGDALVVTVDSLLAAMPRARVLLDPERAALVAFDPRVEVHDGHPLGAAAACSAWRWVRIERAVSGDPSDWTDPAVELAGPGAAGRLEVVGADGEPELTWRTLRALRRERRWRRDDLDPTARRASTLTPVAADTTLAARWGGWA